VGVGLRRGRRRGVIELTGYAVATVSLAGVGVIVALAMSGNGAGSVVTRPDEVLVAEARAPSAVSVADATTLRDGNAAFAGRLLNGLMRAGGNVAVSPFSISEAMAMTYAGARGKTAVQIAEALDFHLSSRRLAAAFNAVAQDLDAANASGASVNVVNALFGQTGTRFRRAFLEVLARDYGAGMRIVDFERAAQAARSAINTWVSRQTHHKIAELLAPGDIDALTRLVLVNAIYLRASWAEPFPAKATRMEAFHKPGASVDVPTMHETARLGYERGPGYRAVELPYVGGRFVFDILLPDNGNLGSMVARIGRLGPLPLVSRLRSQFVRLAIPRLHVQTRFELADTLKTLGMPLAFLPGSADLSGIAGRPGDLYIKAVAHEAYLRIDEKGTEATAATASVLNAIAERPGITVDVNRPFVFFIRDIKSGAIVLLGFVSQP
jgi:serpin B